MSIIPIGDRVLIKPQDAEEKSKGGLSLAPKNDKQDKGTVIIIGDGPEVQRFKEGDKLIFQKYGPADVFIDRQRYVIAHIEEILGKEE